MIFYEKILRAFQKQKVKYVLVGGVAMNLLGSMRGTADLDILVEMSDENLKKITKIMKKFGYHVKQPLDLTKIADEKTRKKWIKDKNMKAFNFYKEESLEEIDIIIESPVSYEEAEKKPIRIKIGNLMLPVISINNLIKMKKKAARTIDKLDIEILKKIKKLQG